MPIVQVCPPAQARPHIPQLLLSLAVFVQVAAMPVPQVVCPAAQAHMPITQVRPAPQAVPQAPQFAGSV